MFYGGTNGERDTYRHTYVEIVAINRDSTLLVDPTCTSIHLRNPSFSSIPSSEDPDLEIASFRAISLRDEIKESIDLPGYPTRQPLFYSINVF